MQPLKYIVEPRKLLVTWQSPNEAAPDRLRRVVGEVALDGEVVVFRYLKGTEDYDNAIRNGFFGFPAFSTRSDEIRVGVGDALAGRLPSERREDFDAFLKLHRLPSPWRHSRLALLGYTGGRLPSDGFAFVPVFDDQAVPCDFITEVAGLRHVFGGDPSSLRPGDALTLIPEPHNPVDQDAIAFFWSGEKLGFLNRAMLPTMTNWIDHRQVVASIERINGKPERPLVYVRIEVR
jgi:hypothetical protein